MGPVYGSLSWLWDAPLCNPQAYPSISNATLAQSAQDPHNQHRTRFDSPQVVSPPGQASAVTAMPVSLSAVADRVKVAVAVTSRELLGAPSSAAPHHFDTYVKSNDAPADSNCACDQSAGGYRSIAMKAGTLRSGARCTGQRTNLHSRYE